MNLNMNSNVNELLDELTELRALYKQLMDDFNKAKNEKNAADSYIKELEKENGKIKNVNNLGNNNYNNINDGEKLNKDFGRYAQMVHLSFDNILNPLSDLINFNEGKLKGNVEYYLDNPLEYEKLLKFLFLPFSFSNSLI
jgi:DNA repair exonuclease SbcCD ATPase subunit